MAKIARRVATTLAAVAATAALSVVTAPAASATIWWDPPPACVQQQWAMSGDSPNYAENALGLYSKAYEYTKVIEYGGVRETQYIWVFEVSAPMGISGMQTVGRAEKLCGATRVATWA